MQEIGLDSRLTDAEKMRLLEKLQSDPRTCPMRIRHPPNGIEHGMGCSMCSDVEAKADNEKAAQKAKEEKENNAKGIFTYNSVSLMTLLLLVLVLCWCLCFIDVDDDDSVYLD